MYRITGDAFEPAAPHSMILFDMPDDRLDGLTPLQATPLCLTQPVEFAAMYQLYGCHLSIYATKAQIGQHGPHTWSTGQVLYY